MLDAIRQFGRGMRLPSPPADTCWHEVSMALEAAPVTATAPVFIPLPGCRFMVISDIDDTVVQTGVANTLLMLWRLFVVDAKSRTAFPGVAALYRGLHAGLSGKESNPMFYVSRARWGTYEVLDAFFKLHGYRSVRCRVPARARARVSQ